MAVDVATLPSRCRHRFPIFERQVYVNSCSQGALSDAVRDAYAAYLQDWDDEGAPWEYWIERSEAARASFANVIGVSPEEVAVTTSESAGIAALATGLGFDDGRDTVVLTDFEFPTVGQIWHAQEQRGARVVHLRQEGETIPLEAFDAAIDERTKLVSLTHVCYRNGAMLDVEAVARLAHERGALVLLDAYQAIGSVPVDARALGVDFLGAGVLKYLLGSAGLGFFYCRRELVEEIRPTATGWFADEDVFRMDIHDYSPARTASRFQSGTPPIPAIYAGIAGMELMRGIGIAETREHVQALNEQLVAGVDELGGRIVTPRDPGARGALICIASTDVRRLVAALAEQSIVTSERDGNLRVSAHCYNTAEDVDAVLAALDRSRELLA